MRVSIDRKVLLPELAAVTRVAASESGVPVFKTARLRVAAGALELAATDLDLSMETVCLGTKSASEPGGVCVPAKKFLQLVQSLPDSVAIKLELVKDHFLTIEAEAINFRLACLPLEDFPALPPSVEAHTLELRAAPMRELLPRVRFAISDGDARYYLCGALFILAPDSMTLVATDGHRLAFGRRTVEMPKELRTEQTFIIPRGAVEELPRLLEGQDTFTFHDTGNHLVFAAGGRVLSSKRIDGTFPNWQRVFEKRGDAIAVLDREAFVAAVKRVDLLASGKSKCTKLSLAAGTLTLEASSSDLGTAQESIPAEYGGPALSVGVNGGFLTDWLSVVNTEKVQLDFQALNAVEGPIGLRPGALPADTDYRCVVMPMRL